MNGLLLVALTLPGFVAGFLVALWQAPNGWRLLGFILGGSVPTLIACLLVVRILDLESWDALGAFVLAVLNFLTWTLGVPAGAAVRSSRARADYPGNETST